MRRRSLLLAAAGACALGARAWAQEPPASSTIEFDWHDSARDRPVPALLYLPHAASAPLPLVLFSHGIGGSRRGYRYLGSHFARHGVASLHLQHVGSDRSLWAGNWLSLLARLHGAAQEREALARVLDLRFALDRVFDSELADRFDPQRIVAAGHSYGANTALLAAGARVEREGRLIDLREPRLRAAMVISAPPFYGEASPEEILAPISLPTLHVTATDDVIRIRRLLQRLRRPARGLRRHRRPAQDARGVRRRLAQHVHRPQRHGRCHSQSAGQGGHPGAGAGFPAQRFRRRSCAAAGLAEAACGAAGALRRRSRVGATARRSAAAW
jgi:predicted dienelactone hydrolase